MFKSLYNNILSLNLNFKLNSRTNLFFFLKKSYFYKNYSNYLNSFISLQNKLKLKTIQTSFWIFNLDSLLPIVNTILIVWVLIELLILC